MANDTWADIRAMARIYARDQSSANPGVPDADLLKIFNRRYRAYYSRFEPRLIQHTGLQTGIHFAVAGITATTTPTNYARCHHADLETSNSTLDGTSAGAASVRILPTLEDLMKERRQRVDDGSGPIKSICFVRAQTTTAASQGKWKVVADILAEADYYISGWFEIEPADLVNTTDAPDVSVVGAADLAVLTAWDQSVLLNRSDSFLQAVLARSANFERVCALLGQDMNGQLVRSPDGRLAA